MFEKWDPDKEKKVRYAVFMKEMEEEIKVIGDPTLSHSCCVCVSLVLRHTCSAYASHLLCVAR